MEWIKKLIIVLLCSLCLLGIVNALPYDISTYTATGDTLSITQDSTPYGVDINPNGKSLYVVGTTNKRLYEYSCTTPFDLSTCSYASKYISVGTAYQDNKFNYNGSKLYFFDNPNDLIREYSCTIPYNISTCTNTGKTLDPSSETASANSFTFSYNGTYFYVGTNTDRTGFQYSCTTPFDLSTCSYTGKSKSFSAQTSSYPSDLHFNIDGTILFVSSYSTYDRIWQYSCSVAYDISTCSYDSKSKSITGTVYSFSMDNDGINIYTLDSSGDKVYQYATSIPPINIDNISLYYDVQDIEINLSSDIQTNMSYVLNNGSKTLICSNCNISTLNFNNLNESRYNITFVSNTIYGEINTTANFTIDLTNPSLNLNFPSEYNYYDNFNFSQYINYSDNFGVEGCTVKITNESNTLCNETSYSFTTNGNKTIEVVATDYAGNKNKISDNIMFINPYVFLYFNATNNTRINNFTLDGIVYDEYAQFKLYDYGLGTHNLLFDKLGYDLINVSITLNDTSNINNTYIMPFAQLIFTFYDVTDSTYIESMNQTTVQIIGDLYSKTFNTSNRNLTIIDQDIINGEYDVIISNPNFETVNTIFTYDNQEVLNLNIYMTPSDISSEDVADLIVEVQDLYGNVQNNILTYIYVWDSTELQYVLINQKYTDYSGQTSYKVFLDTRLYKFCAEYNNILTCNEPVTININTNKIIIPIDLSILTETSVTSIYSKSFIYTLTNTTNGNNSLIEFSWVNTAQDIDFYCLKVYKLINGIETLLSPNGEQCSNTHTSGLSLNITIENETVYIAKAVIELDGVQRILQVIKINHNYNLLNELEDYGLHKIVALILVILAISIGLYPKIHNVILSHISLPIAYLLISILFNMFSLDIFIIICLVNYGAIRLITKNDNIGATTNTRILILIVMVYVIMIFTTVTILEDFNDKNLLDDYGENLLSYLNDGDDAIKTNLDNYIDNSLTSLNDTKTTTTPSGESKTDNTLTFFIKSLKWVDTMFNIFSKIFAIPETIYVMLGFTTEYLGALFIYINWILNTFGFFIFYKELFK